MSFDRFLLAVESCDLSQTDKILIKGSFFGQAEPQLLRDRKRSSATHHSALGKMTLL